MAEDAIVRAIKRLLDRRGAWHIKTTGVAVNGCPDILACYRGHFLAIEVKTLHGVVRPNQHRQLELITRAGGTALVARSADDVNVALQIIDTALDSQEAA